MPTQQLSETARLVNLPHEIQLQILSHLCPLREVVNLITACRKLYNKLIVDFYKEWGRKLNWLPLLIGISQGNIGTLERCLEAGASPNHSLLAVSRQSRAANLFRSFPILPAL